MPHSDYCKNWKLSVNTNKTKIVIFYRVKVRNRSQSKFGKDLVEVVDSYVYLGVLFRPNYNGKRKKSIGKQVNQARKALFCMLSKVKSLILSLHDLFEKLFFPVLLYGCEVHVRI